MDVSEKLTIQALKAHDKVHPNFKSVGRSLKTQKSRASLLSSPEDQNEMKARSKNEKDDGGTSSRRSRTLSLSSQSKKSDPMPKSGITFFRIVAATRAWQRLAKKKRNPATTPAKPTVLLENTYQLGPDQGKIFVPKTAENIIQGTFDSRLHNTKYDVVRSKILAKDLSGIINRKIKELELPRYKTVSSVTIIENKGQGMKIATRCIWNTNTDNFASYTYTNPSLIAIGYVHAVYFE